jgi:hypothetical protein
MPLTGHGAAGALLRCTARAGKSWCTSTCRAGTKSAKNDGLPDRNRGFSYDFLSVLAKNAVNFFPTLSLRQWGQVIFGFASISLSERKIRKSFPQSLHA